MKKRRKFYLLLVVGLFLAGFFIRTGYALNKPGAAQDLREMVRVEGADQDDRGKIFLVTVAQQRSISLWALLYGYLHPHIEVNRLANVIPQGMDERDYSMYLERLMEESKNTARVIALRRAGYDVEIISEGVQVVGFLEQSPSVGILKKGDLIAAVDGERTSLSGEVISAVQRRRVGDPIQLTVLRGAEELQLTLTAGAHPDDPKLPALGVYISTLDWRPLLPVAVEMDTGEIGGPSAGMMFVLEILNQLLPGDLTAGKLVAGTGMIDIDENVGPIGGVVQKVIAAQRAGADYFLVPVENYEDAKKVARRIVLVPVSKLQEALDFLDSLAAAGGCFQLDHGHERIMMQAA